MAEYTTQVLPLFAVLLVFVRDGQGISCLSNNNQKIDWFIYYKPPLTLDRERRFYYMDAENPVWIRPNTNMLNSDHALAHTLNSIKTQKENVMYLYYNDQTKGTQRPNAGHAKGVTSFDDKEGFWIIHSAPNFPVSSDEYKWQTSADRNGQTFLCVTTRTQGSLNNIGKQLKLYNPNIYHRKTARFVESYPEMNEVVEQRVDTDGETSVIELRSSGGKQFRSFAKSRRFLKDIYSDLIAKILRNNLYVQSWLTGSSPKLSSSCDNTFKVYNVEQIRLPHTAPFNSTVDHSKWAVSVRGRWTCIGDINRVESQTKRGGGALCIDDRLVGKQFVELVKSYEDCQELKEEQKENINRNKKIRKRPRSNVVEKAKTQQERINKNK